MLEQIRKELQEGKINQEEFNRKFTMRIFLENVANGVINDDIVEKAKIELEKMDKANEKRKQASTKAQKENLELFKQILSEFNGKEVLAKEVAEFLEISTQKASAILKQGINVGLATQKDNTTKSKPKLYVIGEVVKQENNEEGEEQ